MKISNLVIGLGSIIGGVQALRDGMDPSSAPVELALNPGDMLPAHAKGPPLKATLHQVGSIGSRVKFIQKMIKKGKTNPNVRAFAVKSVSKKRGGRFELAERDYWGEIKSVFKDVRRNVRYVRDVRGIDTFQAANRTLEFGGEDCDGFTIVLGSALESIGYPTKLRIIQTKDAPDFNHIFLLAGLPPRAPTKWVSLDASINKPPGWHPPRNMIAKIKDFDVPV